jgi:hypothetical protein
MIKSFAEKDKAGSSCGGTGGRAFAADSNANSQIIGREAAASNRAMNEVHRSFWHSSEENG